jgi:hypothetical protein
MNGKRRALTQTNELMNEKFNNLSIENKLKVLNVNENVNTNNPRFKYMTLEDTVSQLWFNKTNAEKRKAIKNF